MYFPTFEVNLSEKNWENFINSITFGCYSWVSLLEDSGDEIVYLTNSSTQEVYTLSKELVEQTIWELIIYNFTPNQTLELKYIPYETLMNESFVKDLSSVFLNEDAEFGLYFVNVLCQLALFKDIVYD